MCAPITHLPFMVFRGDGLTCREPTPQIVVDVSLWGVDG